MIRRYPHQTNLSLGLAWLAAAGAFAEAAGATRPVVVAEPARWVPNPNEARHNIERVEAAEAKRERKAAKKAAEKLAQQKRR